MNRYWSFVLCVLLTWPLLVSAQEEDASPGVEVYIKAWLGEENAQPERSWVPSQQIVLNIEVATNSWFTSGTKINGIEIAKVLVKQRRTSAVNFSESENGETWSKQRWEITLYPQQSGEFVVPQTQVTVEVSDENRQKKSVILSTPAIPFRVALPSAELDSSKDWFAASAVSVSQHWSDDEQMPLKVGDSVTRTITINATDSLSVLLPAVMKSESSPLWSSYPAPSELDDKQSRSGYESFRTERQTYIVQTGGDIEWPAYQVWWWNVREGQLEQVTVAGKTIHVRHTLSSWLRYYAWPLSLGTLSLLFCAVLITTLRRYYLTHAKPAWYEFYHALRTGEPTQSRRLLYRKLRYQTHQVAMRSHRCDSDWTLHADRMQGENPVREDFHYLWRRIKKQRGRFRLPRALPDIAQFDTKG